MLFKAIAWLAGITSTSFWVELSLFISLIFLLGTLLCFYFTSKVPFLLFPAIFSLGACWSFFMAQYYSSWELDTQLENKKILIQGWVASVPEKASGKIKFYFRLKEINGKKTHTKIQLNWLHPPSSLSPGERWQLRVKLKRPHSLMNPGGFDQEKFYFKEKIRAVGSVIQSPENFYLNSSTSSQMPNQLRQFLYEKLQKFLPDHPLMGIIIALCLGIRNFITAEQWDLFQATGTSHLVAISGLHISLAAGFFHFLTAFIWRKAYLLHRFPVQQAQACGALVGGFIYSLLAGFSIPTLRALMMMSTLLLSTLYRRNISTWHAFSLAIILTLIIDPLAAISESFWLSFGAVFFIFYVAASSVSFGKSLWSRYGKIQWAVTFALTPFTFLFFQQTSLVSFPANLFAIPWVSFLVIPLALLGLCLLPVSEEIVRWIFYLSSQLLQVCFIFLQYLASFKYACLYQSLPEVGVIISVFLGILLVLSPKGIPGRWLGLLTWLPLFFYPKKNLLEKNVGFTLLDVGQGLSCVIQTRFHTLVFDTGAKFSNRFDMGKAVVLPYLRAQGIKKVDLLIVSHKDNDHMGGAQSVIKNFPVKKILTSVPGFFPNALASLCHKGQSWEWDGVKFQILYPLKESPYLGNNSSCTLQIETGSHHILITGDLEKKGEEDLLNLNPNLSALILVAGHHGSRTSSTWRFVQQVKPSYALFSSGYLNSYRFPHPSVVERYQRINSFMENTAYGGGLYFEISPKGITKKIQYRKMLRRYWHHPSGV